MNIASDERTTRPNMDEMPIDRPYLVERYKSAFIDSLVMLLMMLVAMWIRDIAGIDSGFFIFLMVFTITLYEPIMVANSATIGQRMMGLSIRKSDATGENIGFFNSLIRFIVKVLLGWLSFLTINFNKDKRALHDFAAGSVVIRLKRS